MIWKQKLILYGCEALGLGIFMFSAGVFDILIDHPDLWIRHQLHAATIRRFFIGLSMGLTALVMGNLVRRITPRLSIAIGLVAAPAPLSG